jgi:hypothetical protein
MTQQVEDVVILDDIKYTFAMWSGERAPFKLEDVWLDDYPKGFSTGCYRGWHMALRIRNGLLTLDRVSIVGGHNLKPELPPCEPPHVYGVPLRLRYVTYRILKPHTKEWVKETGLSLSASALNIGKILNWTGCLLLGNRGSFYPKAPYSHPGFRYDQIIECEVINGEVVSVDDKSRLAAGVCLDCLPYAWSKDSRMSSAMRYGFELRMSKLFKGDYSREPFTYMMSRRWVDEPYFTHHAAHQEGFDPCI